MPQPKASILVVEDDAHEARTLKMALEARGYHVTLATDGEQALRKVRMGKPDLVILDMIVPVLDGFAVCAHLRSEPQYESLPIIVLTPAPERVRGVAYPLDGVLRAEVQGYLEKPVEPLALAKAVNQCLAQRAAEQLPSRSVAMGEGAKLNCWEVLACDRGPGTRAPCPAASYSSGDGINEGLNGGRICWTVPGTGCFDQTQGTFADKLDACLMCHFFRRVKREQGPLFRLLSLSGELHQASVTHEAFASLDSFLRVCEELHLDFDLPALIDHIASEARHALRAQCCNVLLAEGPDAVLRGKVECRGVSALANRPLDDRTFVGSAILHNRVVSVPHPQGGAGPASDDLLLDPELERCCGARARSLLAIPVPESGGRPIGAMVAATSAARSFSTEDQWLMRQFAVLAGMAVEKARLLDDSARAERSASSADALGGALHSVEDTARVPEGTSHAIGSAAEASRRDLQRSEDATSHDLDEIILEVW